MKKLVLLALVLAVSAAQARLVYGVDRALDSGREVMEVLRDLKRIGALNEFDLQRIKERLQRKVEELSFEVNGLQLAAPAVTQNFNEGWPSQYSPSCNGNPKFPAPEQACCTYGSQALCYKWTVQCPAGKQLVSANLNCTSYVVQHSLRRYQDLTDFNGFVTGAVFTCQKPDGRKAGGFLQGTYTCQ